MSDVTATDQKKQYSIVRYSRIRDMTTLRHVSNHNTRAVISENVRRDGPAPVELLEDGDPDITVAAQRRANELGLDLPAALRDGKVIAVEAFMGASPEFFEQASPAEVEDWYRASTTFMQRRFGRALISVMKHEDEKTPHLQAVSLAAVEKKVGVKGRPPRDPERRRLHDEKVAAMPLHWTFSYNDLLGGAAVRLSYEQDDYNDRVKHLGLVRGEPQKEVTDLVLDTGVVVAAARISRGKRKDGTDRPARHFTTQEYQAETRRDRARSAQHEQDATQALARAKANEQATKADRAAAAADRELATEALVLADAGRANVAATSADLAQRAAAMTDAEAGLSRRIGNADVRDAALTTAERESVEERLKVEQANAAAIAARADAERLANERRQAYAAAQIARDAAVQDAAAIKEEHAKARRASEAITLQQAAIDEKQRQAELDRMAEAEQVALLTRATDDDEELGLQELDSSIWMNEEVMSPGEKAAYRRHWPAALIVMARHLTRALTVVRDLARSLGLREKDVEARETEMTALEQASARDRADRRVAQRLEHEQALAALTDREAAVKIGEASATAQMAAAIEAQAAADVAIADNRSWAMAVALVQQFPNVLTHDDDGNFRLDHRLGRTSDLPGELVRTMERPAPEWAATAIKAVRKVELAVERAKGREEEAEAAIEQMQDMIAEAGPTLRPEQQAVVARAKKVVRQVGFALHQRDDGQTI